MFYDEENKESTAMPRDPLERAVPWELTDVEVAPGR